VQDSSDSGRRNEVNQRYVRAECTTYKQENLMQKIMPQSYHAFLINRGFGVAIGRVRQNKV